MAVSNDPPYCYLPVHGRLEVGTAYYTSSQTPPNPSLSRTIGPSYGYGVGGGETVWPVTDERSTPGRSQECGDRK